MLALGSIARQVTGLAFDLAGEIVVSHIYRQAAAVTYDPATGSPTPTDAVATVGAIVGRYSHKETDGQKIRFGDEKCLVKASELGAIVPSPDDYLAKLGTDLVPAGQTYNNSGQYLLTGLTVGVEYYFTPDDNGGSQVIRADNEAVIKAAAGFFIAPATSVLLTGEANDPDGVTASVQPIALKRAVIEIAVDPTGTLYTLQTRKAQA